MAIWSRSFETGVDWMDAQHRELIREIDALIRAMNEGKGREFIDGLFAFLDDYVIKHFTAEEFYMEKTAYPQKEFHKSLHKQFMNTVSGLREEARLDAHQTTLLMKAKRLLFDWLINHIGDDDRQLGEHLKSRSA